MNAVKIHPLHGASLLFFLIKDHFSKVAGDAETLLVNPLPFFISAGREALSDLFPGMDVLPPSSKVLAEIVIIETIMCRARKVPPPQSTFGTGHLCFLFVSLGLSSLLELAQTTPGVSWSLQIQLQGGYLNAGGDLNDLSGAFELSQLAVEL